jgi:hypothetical protein
MPRKLHHQFLRRQGAKITTLRLLEAQDTKRKWIGN